jgi:hypothetical protein
MNVIRLAPISKDVASGERPLSKRRPPRAGIGRAKGVPNKNTTLLKDAIIYAAELAGRDVRAQDPEAEGLVSYLRWLAVEEAPTFGTLLGKVLPIQVAGDKENPLQTHNVIEIKIVDPT